MQLTFVIPAYNASKTIARCLDSVYKLKVSESIFEVIVVDDCSTDQTISVVKQYMARHNNITLLCQSVNHRQGAARNRALSIAKGKYIVFLDSDDEIASGVLSATALAERNALDMTILKAERISPKGRVLSTYELPYDDTEVFSGIDFQSKHPYWCSGPVLYVFCRAFLDSVKYPFTEDVLYEDADFVCVHLYYALKMGVCNITGYQIHENPFSITHTMSFKHVCDYALLGTRMLRFYDRIDDKTTSFASSIIEGGCWNITQSCKKLFRLESKSDVRSFYDRFDRSANRESLLSFKKVPVHWTGWTRFCLKNRELTIFIVGLCISTGLFKRVNAKKES